MAVFNSFDEVLHRIRRKLYPNYLPNSECAFFVPVDNPSKAVKAGRVAENLP